jgi:hypothetical protein
MRVLQEKNLILRTATTIKKEEHNQVREVNKVLSAKKNYFPAYPKMIKTNDADHV